MENFINLKYCSISFGDERANEKPVLWVAVNLNRHDTKSDPFSLLFAMMMDTKIESKARELIGSLISNSASINKDIYLEDNYLLIHNYNIENKHIVLKIIPIVTECEKEFDSLIGSK